MLNLRESLLSYQEYFESLLKEKETLVKKVKVALSMQLIEARQVDDKGQQANINS